MQSVLGTLLILSNESLVMSCCRYMFTDLIKNQLEDTARVRGIPKEKVISDVLLADQPTKKFVALEDVAQLVHCLNLSFGNSVI